MRKFRVLQLIVGSVRSALGMYIYHFYVELDTFQMKLGIFSPTSLSLLIEGVEYCTPTAFKAFFFNIRRLIEALIANLINVFS